MKDIIISIINMVNDGKITADDGVKLINAVKITYSPNREAAKKVKHKVKKAVKNAEPKVKKAAEAIKDKSSDAIDSISKGVKNAADGISGKINAGKTAKKNSNSYYDDIDFAFEADEDDENYDMDIDWDDIEE